MIEERKTSVTGGEKGEKQTAYGNIPSDFEQAFAHFMWLGATKYPSSPEGLPNFWKGYPMTLNYEALRRHLSAWWSGEELIPDDGTDDPTIGQHHLLAVVWHAMDMWRKRNDHTWDNRPSTASTYE